ncbi:hypothetical protein [Chitinimonas koreensis]|uniref:hypothetical protein n=1 Tax=Chitinimonas koreensis TaxID=356302 RepID=UPI000412B161|nr:hypothetical protein [Chitinimonas koreensis]QNM95941.1 hypothetical protein H9L41_19275 [Chitinimonas koreensis]
MKRGLILAGLVLAFAAAPAAARQAPLIEPAPVQLSAATGQPQTAEAVRAAIVEGALRLGWMVSKQEPGRLVLTYNKQGKHEVTIEVAYDADKYQIKYLGSQNMNYEKTGEQAEIHPNYNRWISNLIAQINKAALK